MPELSAEKLAEVREALQAQFDVVDAAGHTPKNVKQMEQIADLLDALNDSDPDTDPPAAPAVAASASASASGKKFGASLGEGGARARGGLKPRNASQGSTTLFDSKTDQAFVSEADLNVRFAEALNAGKGLPRGLRNIVASARYKFPEERSLRSQDVAGTTAKLDALFEPNALVATGGICAPVNVSYDVFTIGTAARPLRDGLPQFGADRGGLTFIVPPALSTTAGGVGVWTAANDVNPISPTTKPRVTFTCGSTTTALVDAVTERALVGNLMNRFQPEMVAALLSNLSVNAARTAELNLLGKIAASSTAVSGAQLLGASRDILATVDLTVAAYRHRNRIPRTLQLTAIFPDFVKDMIRADLAREQANSDPLAVSDAQIEGFFSVRNINPIWLLDGLPVNGTGVPYAYQGFGTQNANTSLVDWPHTITWWLFAPGTFVYLNGGILDVGIVRDSTLNATNDLEIFQESFEGIAFRGLSSLQVVSTVRPNGASAAPVSTSSY